MVMSHRFFSFGAFQWLLAGRWVFLKQDETTEARAYGDLSVFGKWPALILFSKNQRHALSMPLVFTCFY
ncbi:hypothetical protein P421_15800 [Heyndrickxia coagulans P38]|nr:hypothetical protein P421_15800 [Heyndrickxia coagulans P38]